MDYDQAIRHERIDRQAMTKTNRHSTIQHAGPGARRYLWHTWRLTPPRTIPGDDRLTRSAVSADILGPKPRGETGGVILP